jgi:hypothetical protein
MDAFLSPRFGSGSNSFSLGKSPVGPVRRARSLAESENMVLLLQ